MHEANRRFWESISDSWRTLRERDGLWRQIPSEPDLAFEGDAYEPGTHPELMDWRTNPRAGLPVWLTVCAEKPLSF